MIAVTAIPAFADGIFDTAKNAMQTVYKDVAGIATCLLYTSILFFAATRKALKLHKTSACVTWFKGKVLNQGLEVLIRLLILNP